jgi:formiminotetrahydrofolate cyclodeaminase
LNFRDKKRETVYIEKPIATYLEALASAQPTPGGGSAAAISGAMAAALASMVSRLTQGKEKYAAVQEEIELIIVRADELRHRFQALMQADITAYGKLSASFKMPKASESEKLARQEAVQQSLEEAALVPLSMVECAAELSQINTRIAEIGNANVLSDIATSAELSVSAALGASYMVRINTQSLKNRERAQDLETRVQQAVETVRREREKTLQFVGDRG